MSRIAAFALVSSLLVVVPACDPAASEVPVEAASAPRTIDAGVLTVGAPQTRTLKKSQAHRYLLQASAGSTIALVASSDVLLPSLRVVGPGSDGKTVAGALDPATVDLRVKTSFTVPASAGSAVYQIFVTGQLDGDNQGSYTLRASASNGGGGGGAHPIAADCASRRGGAFVTIQVAEQFSFKVWVPAANGEFIAHAKQNLAAGTRQNVSFTKMVDGTDCDGQWSWTVDTSDASFPDFSVEVCDGTPEYIEANKAEWFRAPGYYCPWGAKITAVDDRR
jgi:hypothetical protein